MNIYEKYRPKRWSEVLGQDRAIRQIQTIGRTGYGSKAFWISGASGTGKTTLAWLIARELADDFFIAEYDAARKITPTVLDELERTMRQYTFALGKTGRAFIINEAHGLRKDIIERFLGILERIPDHVVFIFTTTKEGQERLFDDQIDASPLLSRCHEIRLTNQGLNKLFAAHCKRIAEREGLDGKPLRAYEQLARDTHNNCRRMLEAIAGGLMLEG